MKTAVEWFRKELESMDTKSYDRLIQIEMDRDNFIQICEQAKEMFEQQIVKSYHEGQLSVLHIVEESLTPLGFDSTSDKENKEDAIDYYNETFKTKI